MEDLIKEILELKENKTESFKNVRMRMLRKKLVRISEIESKKLINTGNYILQWHPKLKSRFNKTGTMMIYTKDSWKRRCDFMERKYK